MLLKINFKIFMVKLCHQAIAGGKPLFAQSVEAGSLEADFGHMHMQRTASINGESAATKAPDGKYVQPSLVSTWQFCYMKQLLTQCRC